MADVREASGYAVGVGGREAGVHDEVGDPRPLDVVRVGPIGAIGGDEGAERGAEAERGRDGDGEHPGPPTPQLGPAAIAIMRMAEIQPRRQPRVTCASPRILGW